MKDGIKIADILYEARKRNSYINEHLISKAYEYAKEKHQNQLRKSGEPYIIHPLNVAYILAELGLDTQTICSALLHDVVEDTDATYKDIEEKFGKEIAQIVEGVTKLTNLFKNAEEQLVENYNKLFIATEKDIRVIILKLADRLHNINTLQYLKRNRQIAISKETIELYAPIAHKLGMYNLKMKLQDGAFKFLYPEQFDEITRKLEEMTNQNKERLENTKKRIQMELQNREIIASVKIERKHLYNIYKKITEKNIEISEIKDLFSIKIITREKSECYRILGIINNLYHIMPKSFKDYIATPRNNNYQAIQEIIVGEKGVVVEVQICTYTMNKIAEYGITNYLSCIKENYRETIFQKSLSGIHDILELKKDSNEFLNTLKDELVDDEIYIFTRKGDIKVLPKYSSAIDFAYSISNFVGEHISGAKINSVNMPVITKLKNGDIVEIITQEQKSIPQEEWLEHLKTAKAKSNILKLLSENKKGHFEKKTIKIEVEDRKNLVLDIAKVCKNNEINIEGIKANVQDGLAQIEIEVEKENESDVKNILNEILEK